MAFNILDILKNEYNNFYNKADVLMWNIDGKKYTSEEFNKLNFTMDKVKESFYVEIEPNSAINMTGHSSFEYSFKVGARKVEYQGVERWFHDGYFLILDDDWQDLYHNSTDEKFQDAFDYGEEHYRPQNCGSIYYSLYKAINLWYVSDFPMIQFDICLQFDTFEETLPTLNLSFNEAMKVVFSIYESRRFVMDYYEKLKKQK